MSLPRPRGGPAAAPGTLPLPVPCGIPGSAAGTAGELDRGVTSLPFPLPSVSAGLAALSPAARRLGGQAAAGAARALHRLLGDPVRIEARPLPEAGPASPGFAALPLSLEALSAPLLLEVEASLACRLLDRLAAGPGDLPPALSLTPIEQAALQLFALVAIDGAAEDPAVAALAPRLLAAPRPIERPLSLELQLRVGDLRGSGRLTVPELALRALDGEQALPPFAEGWSLGGGLVSGSAALAPDELASLAPGDLLLLDEPPSPRVALRLGGFALGGREEEGHFHLEEIAMERSTASLPITLAVEVARVTVTLGELWRLAPGGVLPLAAPRDGRVVLRLDDRPVARGQLVEVEGALAVRIESVEDRP